VLKGKKKKDAIVKNYRKLYAFFFGRRGILLLGLYLRKLKELIMR
jgi:hypothetical protein